MKKFLFFVIMVSGMSNLLDAMERKSVLEGYFVNVRDIKAHCETRLAIVEEKLKVSTAGSMQEETFQVQKLRNYLEQDLFKSDNYIPSLQYLKNIHTYCVVLETYVNCTQVKPLTSTFFEVDPANKVSLKNIPNLPPHFFAHFNRVKKQMEQTQEANVPSVANTVQNTQSVEKVETPETPQASSSAIVDPVQTSIHKPFPVDVRKFVLYGTSGIALLGGLICLYTKKDALRHWFRSHKYAIPFQKKDTLK